MAIREEKVFKSIEEYKETFWPEFLLEKEEDKQKEDEYFGKDLAIESLKRIKQALGLNKRRRK